MKKFLVVCCSLILGLLGCESNITDEKFVGERIFTDEQWLEDIDYLVQILDENHPNPFFYIEKLAWGTEVNQLKEEIERLSDQEITYRLQQLVASLKDSHTGLSYWGEETRYPITLKWFNDELRVVCATPEYEDLLGTVLVGINGTEISTIVEKVNTLISYENNQWAKVNNVRYLVSPNVLDYFELLNNHQAVFEFVGEEDEVVKINLTDIILEEYTDEKTISILDSLLSEDLPLSKQMPTDASSSFWYSYFQDEGVIYFQYNVGMGIVEVTGELAAYSNNEEVGLFNQTITEIQNLIKSEAGDIKKLIIDLRENTGGNSAGFTKFAQSLKLYQQAFPFETYTLIGPQTYSAGVWAAADAVYELGSILIGEETGGNNQCFGDWRPYELPNSKLFITISTKYFNKQLQGEYGVLPDLMIQQSFEEYQLGIDKVLETALEK